MCSPRALVAPPFPVTRVGCLIAEAHSRERPTLYPANYHTLIYSHACRPRFDLFSFFLPLFFYPFHYFSLRYSLFVPFRKPSSSTLITPPSFRLTPPYHSSLTRAVRTAAYGLTVRECHGPKSLFAPADCGRRFRRTAHRCIVR